MKEIKVILSFLLILAICGCASKAYQSARNKDTVEAYKEFLEKYPDSKFTSEAKARREELYFQKPYGKGNYCNCQKF